MAIKRRDKPGLELGDGYRVVRGERPEAGECDPYVLLAHHLATHCVILGMTGSGKTGLLMVMIEEALREGIPILAIDVKGDIANLLLSFPSFDVEHVRPWAEAQKKPGDTRSIDEIAKELAAQRKEGLTSWGINEAALRDFSERIAVRVVTPGSTAGEALHLLSSLERRSARWDDDPEEARSTLSTAVSLVLQLLGRDSDPAKSREHVFLSLLAERRLMAKEPSDLASLLGDVLNPPITTVGALEVDAFVSEGERRSLAAALNALLASPSFSAWRQGASLDVGAWLAPQGKRTPAVIVSVAHLDDEQRALVLGLLLEEVLSWVRSQPGTQNLRALLFFDEIFGFLPPDPHNPPTKKPLGRLFRQARAFGVGIVVATQNPMDIDYKMLSNAGIWIAGRLITDADRRRVVDALAHAVSADRTLKRELNQLLSRIEPRCFVMYNIHDPTGLKVLKPRWAMSLLRGPMTTRELGNALR